MRGRSFWSSIPGLVTGIAGILTATVALLTLLVQTGVIGGGKAKSSTSTTNGATADSTGRSGSGASSATTAGGTPSLQPATVNLDRVLHKEQAVSLENTGPGTITVDSVYVGGSDSDAFSADASRCQNATLKPYETCKITVTYAPSGSKSYSATLVVTAGSRRATADLKGAAVL